MRVYRRDFAGPTRGVRPTPQGGLCVEAAVARTGVLEYSDGARTWREYRPAEEVFAEDSLATLRGASVTDNHPSKLVDPTTFKAVSRGHAEATPRRDGDFVVADLMVQDAELCELVKTGARREVSCGYTCEVDHTPGVTPEGEKYDGVQRQIRHNHVALLAPGQGRSGPEVSLRMDGAAIEVRHDAAKGLHMKRTIKVRGVEYRLDRILEEQGVTRRQDALIARDLVLSLNAQVTRARHEAAGITQYVWRTSGDGDVRPDHRALNGQTFSYDDPPVVNASEVRRGRAERREHPGQDYQCRCTAEPLPEFDDVPAKTDRTDARVVRTNFDPDQPRDKGGQWTDGSGGSNGRSPEMPSAQHRTPGAGRSGGGAPDRNFGQPVDSPRHHIVQPDAIRCGPCAAGIMAAHFGIEGDVAAAIAADETFFKEGEGGGVMFMQMDEALNKHMPVPGRDWVNDLYFPTGTHEPDDVATGLELALHAGGGVAMLHVHAPMTKDRGGYWHVIALHDVKDGHAIIGDPESPTVTRVPITRDGMGELTWRGEAVVAKLTNP